MVLGWARLTLSPWCSLRDLQELEHHPQQGKQTPGKEVSPARPRLFLRVPGTQRISSRLDYDHSRLTDPPDQGSPPVRPADSCPIRLTECVLPSGAPPSPKTPLIRVPVEPSLPLPSLLGVCKISRTLSGHLASSRPSGHLKEATFGAARTHWQTFPAPSCLLCLECSPLLQPFVGHLIRARTRASLGADGT